MPNSNVFVAASERAHLIAEKLRDELRSDDYPADVWSDVVKRYPSESKFDMLQQLIKKYDFAVIIFAKDDALVKKGALKHLNARDSRVFEAGFFMAALKPKRCIIVSSVEKKYLPEVLEGIILYTFTEPENLDNREQTGEAIQTVSAHVKDRLDRIQREDKEKGETGPFSRAELLAKEKPTKELGGELMEDQVVVASIQPRELEYSYASRVRENLDNGIRYVYFVQGNDDAAVKIPRMLQLLLLAKMPKLKADVPAARLELVRANKAKIISDMKDICVKDKLNIYFMSDPLDMEYCIFNATDKEFAKMYVKHREEYIEWELGEGANEFWGKTKKKTGADDPGVRLAVFHAVAPFKLDEESFFSRIQREMVNFFPDIGEQVLGLCLKGPN